MENQVLSIEAYQILKKRIIELKYLPGQLLIVQDVAKELNLSRTPVREAMVRLRSEGLLTDATGRKFRVSDITFSFIESLYSARIILEGNAIDKLREKDNTVLLENLLSNIEKLDYDMEKGDYSSAFEDDSDFHRMISETCNNIVIDEWLESIKDRQMRIRFLTVSVDKRTEKTAEEHRKVYEALTSEDFDAARKLLVEHLQNTIDSIKIMCDSNVGLVSTVVK